MSFEIAVQTAVYSALTSDVTLMGMVTGVHDAVPQDASFPYITVGDDSLNEWDTNTTLGVDGSITIHTWSRYRGRKESKQIQGAIYNALHRAEGSLSYAGHRFILCEQQGSESFMDADALTRHGVQTFRIVLERI
jgi:hypothetical protein